MNTQEKYNELMEAAEERMNIIGQNGNDGLVYEEPSQYQKDLKKYYSTIGNESAQDFEMREWIENAASIIKTKEPNKYKVKCKGVDIDVYDVLTAFNVTNPAIQHAVKKLLKGGARGYKNETQDYKEAVQSINRGIELIK